MFSHKPDVVVYLSAHFIDVYINNEEGSNKLAFPAEIVEDVKVKDRAEYFQSLASFLAPLDLPRGSVLIVLSQDACFQKGVPLQQTDVYPDLNDFVESLSWSDKELAKKEITLGRSRVVVATNKQLFTPVVTILTQLGLKVLGVVPAGLFLHQEVDILMAPEILAILGAKHLLHTSNFLGREVKGANYTPSGGFLDSSKTTGILLGIILALVIALGYILTRFH